MESFDITYKGQNGTLYIDGSHTKATVGDYIIMETDNVTSVVPVGNERLNITWMDGDTKKMMQVRIISAPAGAVYELMVPPQPYMEVDSKMES